MKVSRHVLMLILLVVQPAVAFAPHGSARNLVEKAVSIHRSTRLFVSEPEDFENNGPLAWMIPYLSALGLEPGTGKQVVFGPIAMDLPESQKTNEEQAATRRKQAAENLVNIGPEERERRAQAGSIMLAVSAVYVAWTALIGDDGGIAGHLLRFLSVFPIFLGLGYKISAETGL